MWTRQTCFGKNRLIVRSYQMKNHLLLDIHIIKTELFLGGKLAKDANKIIGAVFFDF